METDFRTIRRLVELVDKHKINELKIDEEKFSLKIKMGTCAKILHEEHAATSSEPIPVNEESQSQSPQISELENHHELKAPMVGTFYRSAEPGAEAFVNVGDRIKNGDTLCIIEAMKVMNEIKSEVDGEIVEILSSDASPVHFGETLFKIKI